MHRRDSPPHGALLAKLLERGRDRCTEKLPGPRRQTALASPEQTATVGSGRPTLRPGRAVVTFGNLIPAGPTAPPRRARRFAPVHVAGSQSFLDAASGPPVTAPSAYLMQALRLSHGIASSVACPT
jgi:hypothetical protein